MKRKTLNLAGAAVMIAGMLSVTNSPVFAQFESRESSADNKESIEGTWLVTVDRINQGVKFTAFQSFTAGGVAFATGSIDRTPPPAISPIYGSWAYTARNRFDVTIYFFVFDINGKPLFLIKNNETFRLRDANHLIGSGDAFMCDLEGEHCVGVASPIQITGKRVIPEGVPQ